MATLKQRLHRKNASGTYDTIHFETSADLITGTLGVAHGGTGITSNPSMVVNLASTAADSVFAASPRPGVTGTLPIAKGGTGQSSLYPGVRVYGVRAITASTADLTAGSTGLTTGAIYLVYE